MIDAENVIWLTFTAVEEDVEKILSDQVSQEITVIPITANRLDKTHYIYASFTPSSGTALIEFKVAQFVVTCSVKSFSEPDIAPLNYNIWLKMVTVDFKGLWIQSPPCGYEITYDW